MSWQRHIVCAIGLLVFCASGLLAQTELEDQVERLQRALTRQGKTIEGLNTKLGDVVKEREALQRRIGVLESAAESGSGENEAQSQLQASIERLLDSQPLSNATGAKLFTTGEGIVDRIRWGGEWRTRGDWRINTSDLLSELDDEGFRLDYRFNLGIGFDLFSSSEMPLDVWFELQSAGRAANNTAEDLQSGISGVGVSDLATRENDLDIVRLYQAYIRVRNLFGVDQFDLKVGRQELRYGSELLLGTNDFFTGTVHDAVRLDFELRPDSTKIAQISLFYAKEAASDNQVTATLSSGGVLAGISRRSGDEDDMAGLYAKFGSTSKLPIDFYYVFFNARDRGANPPFNVTSAIDPAADAFGSDILSGRFHTLGFWVRTNKGSDKEALIPNLFLSLEFAYQIGDTADSNNEFEHFDGFVVDFAGEYEIPLGESMSAMRPRIYFGYYFAEGPDSDRRAGFSPLFISRHNNDPYRGGQGPFSRLGNLDIIPSRNVHVFQAGFKFHPGAESTDWTLGMTYLYAAAHHSREALTVNALGNVFLEDRAIGHEIDVYASHTLSARTELFFNASVFIPESDFVVQSLSTGGQVSADTDVAFALYAHIQVRF